MTAHLCRDRCRDPLAGITASCILDADRVENRNGRRFLVPHAGPHWGPIDQDPTKYQEWPK